MIDKKKHIPIVKDIFPSTNGIFSSMNFNLPIDGSQMDLMFYTDYGYKAICPFVLYVKGDDETLNSEKISLISTMLLNKYRNKWERYNDIISAEYNPIHNYLDEYSENGSATNDETKETNFTGNYNESITTDNTFGRTDNLSQTISGTSSNTQTGTSDQSRYGFNSSESVGTDDLSDHLTNSSTNSDTVTNTGTQTNTEERDEDRSISDTREETVSTDNDKTHQKEGYHRGNIGNITTQKMINEEIELWKWNFVEEMLHDARDFLTLPLYSNYFYF